MKLRELFEDVAPADSADELRVKLVGVLSQLRGRIQDTGANSKITLKAVLSKLRESGITLTAEQLRDMISQPPLKNIIANITGDEVVFKGQTQSDTAAIDAEQSDATLEKMAKRAAKP